MAIIHRQAILDMQLDMQPKTVLTTRQNST